MTTLHTLYDNVDAALHRTRWRPSRPFRFHRVAFWSSLPTIQLLTGPTVTGQWDAVSYDPARGHAFTRRQARQIREALRQAMAAHVQNLEADLLARMTDQAGY